MRDIRPVAFRVTEVDHSLSERPASQRLVTFSSALIPYSTAHLEKRGAILGLAQREQQHTVPALNAIGAVGNNVFGKAAKRAAARSGDDGRDPLHRIANADRLRWLKRAPPRSCLCRLAQRPDRDRGMPMLNLTDAVRRTISFQARLALPEALRE